MKNRDDVSVEQYTKRKGGKIYRDVRFYVSSERCVIVANIMAKDDEAACEMARKCLMQALEML